MESEAPECSKDGTERKRRKAKVRWERNEEDRMRKVIWKQGRKLCLLGVLAALSIFASGCFGGGKEKYTFRANGIDLLEAGDYEGAIQAFDQALEASDGMVGNFELDILKYRAEAECGTGDYEAAANTYAVLNQVDGERPEYLGRSCLLYVKAGAVDKALEQYQRAYAKDPAGETTQEALLAVGQGLTDAGRFDDAMGLYESALSGGMQNAELYNRMGLCQLDAGKISDALDYFEQGLSMADQEPEVRKKLVYNKAAAQEQNADFAGAFTTLESYVQEFGSTAEIEKEMTFLKTR